MEKVYPECLKCKVGLLIPLSDYGREGSSIMYKAWVCTNPECGFNIRIDNGEISRGKEIKESTK
jgi:hypothetical protein